MANCILCNHEGNQITETEYFDCPVCYTRFSKYSEPANYENYKDLYPGIVEWAEKLKTTPNPWRQVANRGIPYQKIMEFFMNQDQKLDILDIGCGYGYVVYALDRLNFPVIGIDISNEAIEFAKKTYELPFYCTNIEDYKGRHDIITAIEVFEHLTKPKEWLKRCLEIAPKVMITTPNLGHEMYKNTIWVSELPPVHMACYRKESLEWLTKDLGIKADVNNSEINLVATFYG